MKIQKEKNKRILKFYNGWQIEKFENENEVVLIMKKAKKRININKILNAEDFLN